MIGWNLGSSSSTTVEYNPSASVTLTSTLTQNFYAISSRTVSITYNSNGGSSVSSTTGTQRWNQYGNTYSNPTLTISSTEPTRTGYNFQGWSTSSSATTVNYDPGDSYTFANAYNSSASITLYAVWEANTYTITYNGNGNTDGSMAASTKTYGVNLTLRSNTFTRTGYTFQGWATSASGSVVYANGATYTANASITLYAVWERATYTNYYRYRNTYGGRTQEDQTRTYGQSFTTLSSSALSYFSSYGWSLHGWVYDSSTSTTRTYAMNTSVTSTTYTNSTSILYWYAISQRTVSINYNTNGGGSAPSSTTGTQRWNQYGTTRTRVNLTITSTVPTRAGYTFLGWATSANATSSAYNPGASYTFSRTYNQSASVTLYAVWQANNPAYYDEDGGYWYVENGYMPQSRVSSSLHTTLANQWSSLNNGSTYHISLGDVSSLTSKVYNGNEYCLYNGEYYLVEPIRWRLQASSSQQTGYGTSTDTLAIMDTIVYVGRYSESAINEGDGYSTTAVGYLDNNQISNDYLVSWTQSMPTYGTTSLYGRSENFTARIFVSSMEEIESVAGDYTVRFSDLVSDYLTDGGADLFYYTRNLGTNINNIVCLSIDGDVTQKKPNLNFLGVQFTIKVTEYACV